MSLAVDTADWSLVKSITECIFSSSIYVRMYSKVLHYNLILDQNENQNDVSKSSGLRPRD